MRNLWERFWYKLDDHGTYEKDGKTYHKYLKTRRFPRLSKRMLYLALLVGFVSLVAAGLFISVAMMRSSLPSPEVAVPIP